MRSKFLFAFALLIQPTSTTTNKTLKVHIVPHTHDDVGWQKTYDQYYYGQNNTIRSAGVRYILDTVLTSLKQDPRRKFTYVEMAFFKRYYNEITEQERNEVKELVKNGQLSFANGGYVMHDEATTHYISMIDQTTLGHAFLKDTFDYTPSVGWQLDPFGHSLFQSELSSLTGFNSLYFGRIDYQDLSKRYHNSECEGVWKDVFWGLTGSYRGNYGPPPGFCLDDKCDDEPITPENAFEKSIQFLKYLMEQAHHTKGDTIMVTMGSDFTYENALYDFKNLDLLLDTIRNTDFTKMKHLIAPYENVDIFYSNPEEYTFAKYNESNSSIVDNEYWSIKEDDFFPYSDCKHCFWTGYFTSRPNFKKMERFSSSLLHMVRQLHSFSFLQKSYESLESSLAIAQHHDAVSGTSKQHVLYDYAKLLHGGIVDATSFAGSAIATLLGVEDDVVYCIELNVSKCNVTQYSTRNQKSFSVVVYNALTTSRSDVISIPVSSDVTYQVLSNTAAVSSVLLPNYNYTKTKDTSEYILYFDTGVIPPLSLVVYSIQISNTHSSVIKPIPYHRIFRQHKHQLRDQLHKRMKLYQEDDHVYIENNKLKLRLDKHYGLVDHVTNKEKNVTVRMKQSWGYYPSFEFKPDGKSSKKGKKSHDSKSKKGKKGFDLSFSRTSKSGKYEYFGHDRSKETQNSGAYIFRPKRPLGGMHRTSLSKEVTILHSDLVTELHYKYTGNAGKKYMKQIIRIKHDSDVIESEYIVGPIPHDKGREVVVQYDTNIKNNNVFYTDSNGRKFMKRKRSHRDTWDYKEYEPVAGNYYPINSAIFIKDDVASLSILTDRSQGGGSIYDGEIELMVHRRTKADDGRGVGEPIDETDGGITPCPPYGKAKRKGRGIVTSGKHYLLITSSNHSASFTRSKMDAIYSPLHLFFFSSINHSSFNGLSIELPENVMLVTFQYSSPMTYLIRLAHQYATGEDPNLSLEVHVDLANLFTSKSFANYKIISVVEKTISGNQDWSEWERKRLHWNGKELLRKVRNDYGSVVTLEPMEIRTFYVVLGERFGFEFDDGNHFAFL